MGADVLWLPCGIGQPFVTREVGPRVARQERVLSGARSTKLLALCGAHNDSLEQQRPGSLDFRVHKGSGQQHGDVPPGRGVLWSWHCVVEFAPSSPTPHSCGAGILSLSSGAQRFCAQKTRRTRGVSHRLLLSERAARGGRQQAGTWA